MGVQLWPDDVSADGDMLWSEDLESGVRVVDTVSLLADESSFPSRVSALLRSRPLADAATNAQRQEWFDPRYDIVTFALTAIDLVVARQGFEDEVGYDEVIESIVSLARRAVPTASELEHRRVAGYVVDALLNRGQRQRPFTYRIADYSGSTFEQRHVEFRLLFEREDAVRGVVVLNATRDAINALVGGLEFDVEDEQIAGEILIDRQLSRGQFVSAERAAWRNRLRSMHYANYLRELLDATRRDLRSVIDQWADDAPEQLDRARAHIWERLTTERRLVEKVRAVQESASDEIRDVTTRIVALLEDCRQRHEALHRQVMDAADVFLTEQDRQAFRPVVSIERPEIGAEILAPVLRLSVDEAVPVVGTWLTNVAGPLPPRVPRLYRLVDDLLTQRESTDAGTVPVDSEVVGHAEPAIVDDEIIGRAAAIARAAAGPVRLCALVGACMDQGTEDSWTTCADALVLASLWAMGSDDGGDGLDLTARVLGPDAAVFSDGTPLGITGWVGDDLIVMPGGAGALEVGQWTDAHHVRCAHARRGE